MNIPDAAIYAAVPTIAGVLAWAAQMFIREQGRNKRDAELSCNSEGPVSEGHLSARDAKMLAEYIEKVLNGRYLLTSKARQWFRRLNKVNEQRYTDIKGELLGVRAELLILNSLIAEHIRKEEEKGQR